MRLGRVPTSSFLGYISLDHACKQICAAGPGGSAVSDSTARNVISHLPTDKSSGRRHRNDIQLGEI